MLRITLRSSPCRPTRYFWIASMSKPIAATALMMLVDEGKAKLADPAQKYLPQFSPRIIAVTSDEAHVRLRRPQSPIALRNLLDHTSGLPFSSSIGTPTLDLFPLSTRVQGYALEPLMFEPGTHPMPAASLFSTAQDLGRFCWFSMRDSLEMEARASKRLKAVRESVASHH